MSNADVRRAQALLYKWLGQCGKVKYQAIKESCDYLNTSMRLGLSRPVWPLLFPLLRTGVVDFAGSACYMLSPALALTFKDHAYMINGQDWNDEDSNLPVGISLCQKNKLPPELKTVKLNSLSVLKAFPTLEEVVLSWPLVLQNGANLEYSGNRKLGISKPAKAGQKHYFYDPKQSGVREIPSPQTNPEAYPVAVCCQSIIGGLPSGIYDAESQKLVMSLYGLPTLLSRALMIDGMAERIFPTVDGRYVLYHHISQHVARELNRIMCKSICLYERPH